MGVELDMNPREREINAPDLSSTHVVVLCAKLKEGKSRLSKDTGPEFAKEISRAMLLDILNIVSDLPIWSDFVLYFTPDDSREEASGLLNTLDERVARRWTLMPMPSEEGGEATSKAKVKALANSRNASEVSDEHAEAEKWKRKQRRE